VTIPVLSRSSVCWSGGVTHPSSKRAPDRRADLDNAVKQMKTQADAMKVKFDKLNKASGESWGALRSALSESRDALDRAYQAAQEAFKRAS